jgi:spermidine synthase
VKPWQVLGRARTPDGVELTLKHHVSEYVIMANDRPLMSSRMHASEDALAVLGCRRAAPLTRPHVLVGGLGMGFTLRAALDILPPAASVVVAELVPEVVEWNRGPLGTLAKHPLKDPRVRIEQRDVAIAMQSHPAYFDAILLDVDNGPASLTASSNDGLYDREGVSTAHASLRSGGTLAVWSANDNRRYERTLRAGGFSVKREHVSGHTHNRGPRHTILVAVLTTLLFRL